MESVDPRDEARETFDDFISILSDSEVQSVIALVAEMRASKEECRIASVESMFKNGKFLGYNTTIKVRTVGE